MASHPKMHPTFERLLAQSMRDWLAKLSAARRQPIPLGRINIDGVCVEIKREGEK